MTAYVGGFGPALVAAALAVLGDASLFSSGGSLRIAARSGLVLLGGFAMVGALIAVAGGYAPRPR